MLHVHPRRPLLVATLSSLVFPLPLFFLAGRAPTVLITIAGFLAGGFNAVFAVQWSTTLQREIPSDMLARVSAYDWFGSLVLLPIGMAMAGPLATAIGITTTLVGSGGLMILSILALLAVPSVTRLRALTPE
jgi:nicotinamide riboside transporter PnuC